jgi:hypothetical protein
MRRVPQFGRNGDLHTVSIITGPKHVWLGLSFSESPISQPAVIERSPVGVCAHGSLDPALISKAVIAGASDAGGKLFVSRIEYIADDTPDYSIYRNCAMLLQQRAAEG